MAYIEIVGEHVFQGGGTYSVVEEQFIWLPKEQIFLYCDEQGKILRVINLGEQGNLDVTNKRIQEGKAI